VADDAGLEQLFLLPILGILVTFVLEPKRGRVLRAKVVAALGLGVGMSVVMLVTSVAGKLAVASALWIGVPMALGVMRVRRTEVKWGGRVRL